MLVLDLGLGPVLSVAPPFCAVQAPPGLLDRLPLVDGPLGLGDQLQLLVPAGLAQSSQLQEVVVLLGQQLEGGRVFDEVGVQPVDLVLGGLAVPDVQQLADGGLQSAEVAAR